LLKSTLSSSPLRIRHIRRKTEAESLAQAREKFLGTNPGTTTTTVMMMVMMMVMVMMMMMTQS
jgi:carbon starvation protein CstA